MATRALNSGLWVRRLLIGRSPFQGRCPSSEVNDGDCSEKSDHLSPSALLPCFFLMNFLEILRKFYVRLVKTSFDRYFFSSDLLPFSLREIRKRVKFSPVGVVHVGAHNGLEVNTYLRLGLKKIHLFEPQPFAIDQLLRSWSKYTNVFIHNLALGSQPGFLPMYVEPGLSNSPNRSASASLLEPASHLKDYSYVKFQKTDSVVQIVMLDSLSITDCDLLVVDTQGFDLEVLKGAANTLHYYKWIICEYWSNDSYVNACTLDQIKDYLIGFGFIPVLQSYDRTFGDILFTRLHLTR